MTYLNLRIGDEIVVIFPTETPLAEENKQLYSALNSDLYKILKTEPAGDVKKAEKIIVFQCFCGGQIPLKSTDEKYIFCPYCGAFFQLDNDIT